MQQYEYIPKGVCARKINFDMEDGKLYNVKFTGGCAGNTAAIGKLLEGADAAHTVEILKGNLCGFKGTSCADQLALGIEKALSEN
ncbi:TIGR03905 family TSCPD domain-containing protein [Pseudobutyrivibrio sp. MD2005]|uniref:TIGR03905 family TSCPD domain-containing protein n=1 Tax=Pseudobutyrivibrio sp. MD2005 TaxID=1410616 RepID=UPI0004879097|nr:TIGR03905 family TSCPD domain-containing protein [Pseudobutyrivibrio sp. MD2005]